MIQLNLNEEKTKKRSEIFLVPLQLRIQTGNSICKEDLNMPEKYEYAGKLVFLGGTN